MAKNKLSGSVKAKRITMDIIVHIFLTIVAVVWVLPFVYLIAQSLRGGGNNSMDYSLFFPDTYSFKNYIKLFTDTAVLNFPRMFMNTFVIACCSCVISTFFVLAVSYCMSRLKWNMRKPYMDMKPGNKVMTMAMFM